VRPPAPLVDFVLDPDDDQHLIAATADGLHRSRNRGADWRRIRRAHSGYLAWDRDGSRALLSAAPDGTARRSDDGGRSWQRAGKLDGEPTVVTAHAGAFYVALANGTIEASQDGGRTWRVRAEPPS
jgi:hypothetical protein